MKFRNLIGVSVAALAFATGIVFSQTTTAPATRPLPANPSGVPVGERIPSEDSVLADFHSLGLINGNLNIFRCACPVRDLAKKMAGPTPTAEELAAAKVRMQRIYDLGIRTDISFESPMADSESAKGSDKAAGNPDFVLEKAAAEAVGLNFVSRPIANSGKDSLQDMTDQQVLDLIDPIAREILADGQKGGVVFHCAAGHDRTGIVAAYIRIKFEHWTVAVAIDEMRGLGHNWPKYSANGGVSSWHEEHLKGIAKIISESPEK